MTIGMPQWTEALYKPVSGQDHLGIGSVITDRIFPSLSPGINVLTTRPRYWSFYAFVVDEFWKTDLPQNTRSFRRFLRRQEAMYSIACHLCDNPEHGASAIGSRRVKPLVARELKRYEADFDYMKSPAGGYGLYYASVMQSTGVIRTADPSAGLPVDAVTPEIGSALAGAFREAISETQYWKRHFNKDRVPASVLKEYADVACLCRLRDPVAPDRLLMADVICHGGPPPEAEARLTSLRFFLEIAHQAGGAALSREDWRRLLLYRETEAPSGRKALRFSPPDDLRDYAIRWRLSQLREMLNFSLNGMWAWLHRWGLGRDGDIFPVPMTDIEDQLRILDVGFIDGLDSNRFNTFMDLIDGVRSAAQVTDELDDRWRLDADVTEDRLVVLASDEEDPALQLSALFTLYVLCLARIWDPDLPGRVGLTNWAAVREGAPNRLGMEQLLNQLRWDAQAGRTVEEVLQRVMTENIIQQHQRVAMAKLPEDTYRFRREGNNLRFFDQPTGYSMNDPRFNSLATMCTEIGWCLPVTRRKHSLTSEGATLRGKRDLPRIVVGGDLQE